MDNKNALVKAMMDVEYCPPSELAKMNIDMTETQKFPIEKAAALGVAFQPLMQLVNNVISVPGQSGLYFVNTAGKKCLIKVVNSLVILKQTMVVLGAV